MAQSSQTTPQRLKTRFLAKDTAKIVSYEVKELFIHTFVSELLLAFTCAFLLMSTSGLYSEP